MPHSIVVNHYPFNEQIKSYLGNFDETFRRTFKRNTRYFLNGQSPMPRIHNNDIILVVIDQAWIDVISRQRIPPDKDSVRFITATALNSRNLVFPILVGDVDMPSEQQLPDELKRLAHLVPFHFGQPRRQAEFAAACFSFMQNTAFVKDLLTSVGGGCLDRVDRVFLKELRNRLSDFPFGALKDRLSTTDKREMRELVKAMKRRKPRPPQDYARRAMLAALWAYEANQTAEKLSQITKKVNIRVCLKAKRLKQLNDFMNQLASAYGDLLREATSRYPGPPPGAIIPKRPIFNPFPTILRLIAALLVCSVITYIIINWPPEEPTRSMFGNNSTEDTGVGRNPPGRSCEPACDEFGWFGRYEVGRGDNLEGIAREVGEDPDLIAEVNCLEDFEVSRGQQLCVPEIEVIPEPEIGPAIDLTNDFEEPRWGECEFIEEENGLVCPMTVVIFNNGSARSTGTFRFEVWSENGSFYSFGTVQNEVVGPNSPLVIDDFPFISESGESCFDDGECIINAFVDIDDSIAEINEDNNFTQNLYEGAIID